MESFKKIIPFVIIAIVFALGGYAIGSRSLSNNGASVLNLSNRSALIKTIPGVGTTGPTDPSSPCPGGICNGGMDMKVSNTTDMNPAKIKLRWDDANGGSCQILVFDNKVGGYGVVGVAELSKKDCHAIPVNNPQSKEDTLKLSATSSVRIGQTISSPIDYSAASIMRLVWAGKDGCLLLMDKGKYTTTSIPEKDCHAIKQINPTVNKSV